ncbi:MAG: DUF2961 domain-containing protein [Bacilli bacterium]|jgi:hypothetical protein|nr:DUF2961 domain-containing protein [Bacilli bacterium]
MEEMDDKLYHSYDIETRSISPENPTGNAGQGGMSEIPAEEFLTHPARELGLGYKIRPFVNIKAGSKTTLADFSGMGMIRHIWMVNSSPRTRDLILRIYFDGVLCVETPLGDFFFNGWDYYQLINSRYVAVNPAKGYNCFWPMPFRKGFSFTLENRGKEDEVLYYQIDFQLRNIEKNDLYFHAQFARTNPLKEKEDFVILDTVKGKGKLVGIYLAYQAFNTGWWGEGEVKMFLDDDGKFPTYCGTGTEDYFLGAYNFENWKNHSYENFSSLYSGFCKVNSDVIYNCQSRFGMYRIHEEDPVYFKRRIKVTIQSLGWQSERRFHPQKDDLAAVAFYYLEKPGIQCSRLPDNDSCQTN